VLRRQPATRRSDEGTARRDDRTQSARHPRLVPEQALQGQETVDTAEADPTAPSGGCKYLVCVGLIDHVLNVVKSHQCLIITLKVISSDVQLFNLV